ncbi:MULTISPECIES: hypothetical protein [unclassified Burkholderia]|uniref:hypothetical protein n=1 Tax=unclassified Burkholderia TaxID=2613784 RepID=UPI0015C68606|nr:MULTISPECIES: hypothetical protein [unclassified Burkholderia]
MSDDSMLARRAVRDARARTRLKPGAARRGAPPGRGSPRDAGDGVAEAASMRRTTRDSEATMAWMHAVSAWRPRTGSARVPV